MNETLLNALHLLINPDNLGYRNEQTSFLPEPKVIGTVSQ